MGLRMKLLESCCRCLVTKRWLVRETACVTLWAYGKMGVAVPIQRSTLVVSNALHAQPLSCSSCFFIMHFPSNLPQMGERKPNTQVPKKLQSCHFTERMPISPNHGFDKTARCKLQVKCCISESKRKHGELYQPRNFIHKFCFTSTCASADRDHLFIDVKSKLLTSLSSYD